MNKTYVIKNTKSGKYLTNHGGWSKNLFLASQYNQHWVDEVNKATDDWALSKNERFVPVKMMEVK